MLDDVSNIRGAVQVFHDEEAEAVPAESVHLERKATGYLNNYIKKDCLKKSVSLIF